MDTSQSEVIDSGFIPHTLLRRRKLLPWWIKMFCWIFMLFGAIVPVALVVGIFGIPFVISLYGVETTEPLSLIGLLFTAVFLFKGITAFGLWTEKDWAVNIARIDAILGICICSFVMLVNPLLDQDPGFNFTFRLELILLIPYLIKLENIKTSWKGMSHTT